MGPDPSAGGDAGSSGAATSGTSTEPATSAVGSGSDGPTCDPDTQMLCGTTCRNILDDRKNCGDCGVMCTANDQCIDGVCG